VKVSNNFSISIHTTLRDLIEAKSKRDNVKFTSYQLANSLCMPRSIISKLTHPDKSKRIINPKIETLLKIVEFFRADGFNITIDDFLGLNSPTIIDVQASLIPNKKSCTASLYSLNNMKYFMGNIKIDIPRSSENILALYAEENIEPFFKIGSIFIIDLNMKPTHDTLVAIKLNNSEKIHIKKFYQKKNAIFLKSLSGKDEAVISFQNEILGVVIRVNAKT